MRKCTDSYQHSCHGIFIKQRHFVALRMIREFIAIQAPIAFCMLLFINCTQNNLTNEISKASIENAGKSTFEDLYQLASQKNLQCIELCDAVLNTTSDQNTRAEIFFIKGLFYANIQDLKKAEQYFDSTILENYTFYDAYIEKGIILNQQGSYQNALETLQIAFNLTKNNPDLYYWIGKSYEGLKKTNEAIRFYEWTLQADPNYDAAEEALTRLKQ
ncbi:MAG: tetratricopeptide repeat protein [Bacteroidota bacterium]